MSKMSRRMVEERGIEMNLSDALVRRDTLDRNVQDRVEGVLSIWFKGYLNQPIQREWDMMDAAIQAELMR